MAEMPDNLKSAARWLMHHRGLALPALAAGMVFVVLVPLPPAMVDVLLAGSLALSAVILLTAIYIARPLDFSVFPSVLLGATLLRLVLNVATTRLILTAGAQGQTVEQARHAAGRVVWAFSSFVTSGSLTVGVILFAILIVVQFIVITRGAGRISEVAARFVLDAMPGKQMAIDADRNAGLISDAEARDRRETIAREADFYGAMDGASKFLRGDAVAGVLITLVNILGGCYVGMVQYGWSWSDTAELFTRLTIGDGLVTQVPAFIVSLSAALLITRPTARTDLGKDVLSQLAGRPIVLALAAVFLAALALTNLPTLPLLLLAAGCGVLAWTGRKGKGDEAPPAAAAGKAKAESLQDLLAVDPLQLEIGYALVRLVDENQGGDLTERISALRRQIAGELGLVVAPIRIVDNLQIPAHTYVIRLRGARVAMGRVYPAQMLAIAGEGATEPLVGRETTDPASGLPAVWISPVQRERAEMLHYTVADPAGVLMAHLGEVVRSRAADLLTREQVSEMLDALHARAAHLVDEIRQKFALGQVQKVLQALLRERVSVRDLETILDAISDCADLSSDVEALTARARSALSRALSQQYCGRDGKLRCVSLPARLERTLEGAFVSDRPRGGGELARKATVALAEGLGALRRQGHPPVVLCSPALRPALRKALSAVEPAAAVLAYNEIESTEIESVEIGVEE